MEEKYYEISSENIKKFVNNLIEQHNEVIAPKDKDGDTFYDKINNFEDADLNILLPKLSFKEYLLPKTETLFEYSISGSNINICDPLENIDVNTNANNSGKATDCSDNISQKRIIFGSRPCDAGAGPIMEKVFNWDYKDEFFNERFKNLYLISIACDKPDNYCFCTEVQLSPESSYGSDILLKKGGSGYYAKVITEKGMELINSNSENTSLFKEISKDKFPADKDWKAAFDIKKTQSYLDKNFTSNFFQEKFLSCIGCGVCTYTCPTCHCFDIQDEGTNEKGKRIRNWDSCQFGIFTLHTSGHNPRVTQGDRYRQRLMHKFKIYNEKFNKYLCVGCGRCSRNCPEDIDLKEITAELSLMENSNKQAE
ncbi:MAG: 4Fe-4S dicluster domain-containing protein [Deltaproteobacteria bacterium]|nr:4Fe-4S dicluster domain-containing protein [Deltaproteobacteria bacterium]